MGWVADKLLALLLLARTSLAAFNNALLAVLLFDVRDAGGRAAGLFGGGLAAIEELPVPFSSSSSSSSSTAAAFKRSLALRPRAPPAGGRATGRPAGRAAGRAATGWSDEAVGRVARAECFKASAASCRVVLCSFRSSRSSLSSLSSRSSSSRFPSLPPLPSLPVE